VRVRLASPALIILLLLGFLRVHYQQLPAQSTNVVVPFIESNDNCTALVADTKSLLHSANLQVTCSLLVSGDCTERFQQLRQRALPESVFERSKTCDIDFPAHAGAASEKEKRFPLAYLITAYRDARNLEHLLATIFHPQNAYCIHIDPKADSMFLDTVRQLTSCYRQIYADSLIFLSSRVVILIMSSPPICSDISFHHHHHHYGRHELD